MNLPLKNVTRLLIKARVNENEKQIINRWLIGGYEQRMSFKEFKNILTNGMSSRNKPTEEILEDVKDIINTFNKKGGAK